jgi:hypothetical protein
MVLFGIGQTNCAMLQNARNFKMPQTPDAELEPMLPHVPNVGTRVTQSASHTTPTAAANVGGHTHAVLAHARARAWRGAREILRALQLFAPI